jgi:hypothetical protein
MMRSHLQERWELGELPVVKGVIIADGRVELIDVSHDYSQDVIRLLSPLRTRSASFDELSRDGGLVWTEYGTLCEDRDEKLGFHAYGGEGSFGGDGFVALVTIKDGALQWAAVFDESNPFVEISLSKDYVDAISNHNIRWRFPLSSPADISTDPSWVTGY